MRKSRPHFPSEDMLSSAQAAVRSREWEGAARLTEYLGPELASRNKNRDECTTPQSSCDSSLKGFNMQWVYHLTHVAEGLMSKLYQLNQILDYPDSVGHVYSEAFWKAGLFPNQPKIGILLDKKFPEHHSNLLLERVDKFALDAMCDSAELHLQSLEPWIQVAFFCDSLNSTSSIQLDVSTSQFTVMLFSCMAFIVTDENEKLTQYVDSYEPPLKGLHEDLNFISPRIGEVLEAVGPIIFLATDTRKLRNEGFLSPFHPRYPDIRTNSAHPMRAQDLANVTSYREWELFGYLVCPDELLRVTSIDIALVVLKETLVLTLFRDDYILLHEEYQSYVLPRILESKKIAKSGRTKQKEAYLEYSVAQQVEKMISEVHEQALNSCDAILRERRILLKQEIGRMVLFFTDQPSL